ncbi:LysR family transcriptional regulator [Aminobacter sp. MSH1]|uniref:LysR family transcriptional regulator n=1 Tax=Aminobacter sp. MSH1 TaxID=374606 RepID=UPI000D395155|nr:LysR family transcriptional regulator [Aminobacter sp. MSH1]
MSIPHADLAAFVTVAEHLSFHRAAIARNVTRSAISHAIRRLEAQLGVRLLNRNTRGVSLTEAGRQLSTRLQQAFADIDQAVDDVNHFRDTPHGSIRITVPRAVGLTLVAPIVATLTRRNPGLSVEVSSNDGLVDIVQAGFDAGIRFGESLQQDMIAMKINFPLHFAVVGSPEYLAGVPVPQVPADLAAHSCIRYRFPSGVSFPWEFRKDGTTVQIEVHGPILLDDQELMIETALAGAGLAFVFAERVQAHLDSGRLVRCLADWTPQFSNLYLYYPDRTFVPAGLRALADLLRHPRAADLSIGVAVTATEVEA